MERLLDNWIDSYMLYTENTEPPILYRRWAAVSIIAACLQRKCRLDWGTLKVYPNLYIVLVGPTGAARKGTAMRPAEDILRSLGIKLAAEAITREALIKELASAGTPEESDFKMPALHASLTIFSEELTVFLGWNNQQLMMDLTAWFDCKDEWTYRTKHYGDDKVVGVWVNLFGATTPALIRSALPHDAVGGGLTARMIFVYEEKKGKVVIFPDLGPEAEKIEPDLKTDLSQINMLSGKFSMDEGFFDTWASWYPKQESYRPFSDDRFGGYFQRRPHHILKLSMIMSAARNDKMVLTVGDFEKSLQLLKETEVRMPKTFGGMGESRTAAVTTRVMAFIGSKGETDLEELMSMFYQDADRDTMGLIIRTLESMGFCKYMAVSGKVKLLKEEKKDGTNDERPGSESPRRPNNGGNTGNEDGGEDVKGDSV